MSNSNLDLEILEVSIRRLSKEWFETKQEFFKQETFFDSKRERIYEEFCETEHFYDEYYTSFQHERNIIINIDLLQYCWNSYYYGGIAYCREEEYLPPGFPIDSMDVSADILRHIETKTTNFTYVPAIHAVILAVKDSLISSLANLISVNSDELYKRALSDFQNKTEKKVAKKYSHIYQQLRLGKILYEREKPLTIEICQRIVEFKLNGSKLITGFENADDAATCLYNLLTEQATTIPKIKVSIEDWKNQDVYYFIESLLRKYQNTLSIALIEKKRCLYLKTGKLFDRTLYDKFKSVKGQSYEGCSNAQQIRQFISSL